VRDEELAALYSALAAVSRALQSRGLGRLLSEHLAARRDVVDLEALDPTHASPSDFVDLGEEAGAG